MTFGLNVQKTYNYNFELYRFKVGAFFETECMLGETANFDEPYNVNELHFLENFHSVNETTTPALMR